jgi:micrococcal nuclease
MSRSILVLGALILLATVAARALADASDPDLVRTSLGAWRLDAPAEEMVTVRVERVVDGDTLDVTSGGETLRVRVYGINTPERGQPCYGEATRRLEALAGAEVRLLPDERLEDRYGRELRYLAGLDGNSIDAALVAEGLALAWREDGSLRDELVDIEEQARASRVGCLWAQG